MLPPTDPTQVKKRRGRDLDLEETTKKRDDPATTSHKKRPAEGDEGGASKGGIRWGPLLMVRPFESLSYTHAQNAGGGDLVTRSQRSPPPPSSLLDH